MCFPTCALPRGGGDAFVWAQQRVPPPGGTHAEGASNLKSQTPPPKPGSWRVRMCFSKKGGEGFEWVGRWGRTEPCPLPLTVPATVQLHAGPVLCGPTELCALLNTCHRLRASCTNWRRSTSTGRSECSCNRGGRVQDPEGWRERASAADGRPGTQGAILGSAA